GPNYFVLRDTMSVPTPLAWRIWFCADKFVPNAHGALVTASEDVDTDLFLADPDSVNLTTESKTRSTYGYLPTANYGKVDRTQQGLICIQPRGRGMLAVVFP